MSVVVKFRVIECVVENSFLVSFRLSSCEGICNLVVTLNSFRRSGFILFFLIILEGKKKVLWSGRWFSGILLKVLFSR